LNSCRRCPRQSYRGDEDKEREALTGSGERAAIHKFEFVFHPEFKPSNGQNSSRLFQILIPDFKLEPQLKLEAHRNL
jgi:hypothetical protein